MQQRGAVSIFFVFGIILLLFYLSWYLPSKYKSQNPAQSNLHFLRFNTLYGGEFDLSYPTTYFASQDYISKAVSFKLINCQTKCDTLIIGDSNKIATSSGEELINIAHRDYLKISDPANKSLQIFVPKWSDKLGVIKVNLPAGEKPVVPDEFLKIIGSLKFVKEVVVSKAPSANPKSSAVTIKPSTNVVVAKTPTPVIQDKYNRKFTEGGNPVLSANINRLISSGVFDYPSDDQLLGWLFAESFDYSAAEKTFTDVREKKKVTDASLLNIISVLQNKLLENERILHIYFTKLENNDLIVSFNTTKEFVHYFSLFGADNKLKSLVKQETTNRRFTCASSVYITKSQVYNVLCYGNSNGDSMGAFQIDFNKQTAKQLD